MQETLTHKPIDIYGFYTKKKKASKRHIVILCYACVFFTVIVFSVVGLCKLNFENKYNSQIVYYLLSTNRTNKAGEVEKLITEASELKGAEYVYKDGNNFEIIAFVYLDFDSAKTVLNRVKETYSRAKIIEIKCDRLNKTVIKRMRGDKIIKSTYDELILLTNKLYKLALDYDKEGDKIGLYLEIEKIKISIQNLERVLENHNALEIKTMQDLRLNIRVRLTIIEKLKNAIYDGSLNPAKVKLAVVESCLEDYLLLKMLNSK